MKQAREAPTSPKPLHQSLPASASGGRQLRLGVSDVHVWVTSSDGVLPPPETLSYELSVAELARARRFKVEVHRRRFVAARLHRRRVLAEYLGRRPGLLAFRINPNGKPELEAEPARGLSFNETESDGVAVVAVARGRSLGVDVEHLRPVPEAERIVSDFGSALEQEAFAGLRADERQDLFLPWWTCKEAFVKALGKGLSMPLASFSILVSAGGRVELAGSDDWSLHTFQPAPGYVGALVAEGRRLRLRMKSWPRAV
jgi:4'-phosphopantetheinyl transferase